MCFPVGSEAGRGVALQDDARRHDTAAALFGGGEDQRCRQSLAAMLGRNPQVGAGIEADDAADPEKRRVEPRAAMADGVARVAQ
ncbi:MAG: hypothetical protein CVU33_20455 [Betaproteobacteria bacterium HGW-Betaproteobacteria-6]|nr:MAG: hypothetical protein CVU33_20455 [Betaproteobacteria bacterium HGW-Betaproteobacteria-6]